MAPGQASQAIIAATSLGFEESLEGW